MDKLSSLKKLMGLMCSWFSSYEYMDMALLSKAEAEARLICLPGSCLLDIAAMAKMSRD